MLSHYYMPSSSKIIESVISLWILMSVGLFGRSVCHNLSKVTPPCSYRNTISRNAIVINMNLMVKQIYIYIFLTIISNRFDLFPLFSEFLSCRMGGFPLVAAGRTGYGFCALWRHCSLQSRFYRGQISQK